MHDDPGPARCRCGWPLIGCQSMDGKVTGGYDYAKRLNQKVGVSDCPRDLHIAEQTALAEAVASNQQGRSDG